MTEPRAKAGQKAAPPDKRAGQKAAPPDKRAGQKAGPPGKKAGQKAAAPGKKAGQKAGPPGKKAGQKAAAPGKKAGQKAAAPGKKAGQKAAPTRNSAIRADLGPPAQAGSGLSQASRHAASVESEARPFVPVSPRVIPRFAGISTFLRLPAHEDPRGVDVSICGVPFDGGTTFRPGARFGPRAVRTASALTRGYHPDAGFDLFETLRCADGGDVLCIPMSLERTLANIEERAREIARAGAVPALVGGDHTISLGALRALSAVHGPLGLIHFDAHSDTFGPAWGIPIHHGTIFRNAAEEGLLRTGDVMQLGIRGPFSTGNDLDAARAHAFEIVMIDEIKRDLDAVAARLRRFVGCGPCYVSFDLDAIDPAFAPGTGTPVPGGMSSHEALRLVRALAGVEIVGCDVVEISPDHDPSGNTALLAATVLAQLLASLAESRRRG